MAIGDPGTRGKITPNVRRILMSQKTFRNYLDDEEAALAQAQPTQSTQRPSTAAKVIKPLPAATTTSVPPTPSDVSTPMTSAETPQPPPTTGTTGTSTPTQPPQGLIHTEFDNDPLLRSYIPSAPSERIMQALLSEPPLSYNASRAGPPTMGGMAGKPPPKRHFCSICGYWGGIRCRKCHARTCGLDCYKVHEETRCDKFYA